MKYAYDYANTHTRGWCRGEFEPFSLAPTNQDEGANALKAVAATWANGTQFRLVEIADDGTETFPPVVTVGTRGPLPKDKKDV